MLKRSSSNFLALFPSFTLSLGSLTIFIIALAGCSLLPGGTKEPLKLLTSYSPKSCVFIEKMKLKKTKYSVSEVEELPTFLLMDDNQILLIIKKTMVKRKLPPYGQTMKPS